MIRVLIIGDVRIGREGIVALLSQVYELEVAALAPTAEDVTHRAAATDVLVVDGTAENSAATISELIGAEVPVVVLGAPDQEQDVIALAEAGVVGFVEREAPLDDLIESIHSAARGEASFPSRIATVLLKRVSVLGGRRDPADATTLTVREREVVHLIAEGLSNKEIAARLCIELATVKNHVHNILEKLEVSRRAEAVARLGIVDGKSGAATTIRFPVARSTPRSRAG
jgi:two-component system nitrate/nitrite response regulator NarL